MFFFVSCLGSELPSSGSLHSPSSTPNRHSTPTPPSAPSLHMHSTLHSTPPNQTHTPPHSLTHTPHTGRSLHLEGSSEDPSVSHRRPSLVFPLRIYQQNAAGGAVGESTRQRHLRAPLAGCGLVKKGDTGGDPLTLLLPDSQVCRCRLSGSFGNPLLFSFLY